MLQRDETHLWVAGHQNLMLEVDLKKGAVSKKVNTIQYNTIQYNTIQVTTCIAVLIPFRTLIRLADFQ